MYEFDGKRLSELLQRVPNPCESPLSRSLYHLPLELIQRDGLDLRKLPLGLRDVLGRNGLGL